MTGDFERPGELDALKKALAPAPMPAHLRAAILEAPSTPRRRPIWTWPLVAAAAGIIIIQSWRIHDLQKPAPSSKPPETASLEPSLAESNDIVLEVLRGKSDAVESLQANLPSADRARLRDIFDEALAGASRSLKSSMLRDGPSADLLASLDLSGLDLDARLRESRHDAAHAWGAALAAELASSVGLDEDQKAKIERALAGAARDRNDVLVLPGVLGADSYAILTGLVRNVETFLHDDQRVSFEKFVAAARADLREKASCF